MNRPYRIYNMATPSAHPDGDSWFRIKNAAPAEGATAQPLEVELYDGIGNWGIRAADFLRELREADDGQREIHVGINSLGGEVFDGLAIHNFFRRLGNRLTVRVDGVAASIASVIACGAARLVMPDNTMLMIHNPWTQAGGEADDLRNMADMMDKSKANLIACYRSKAPGLSEQELSDMMSATTWLSAQEALALGLVDEVLGGVTMQASAGRLASLGRLHNVPAPWLASVSVKDEPIEPAKPAVDPEPVTDPAPAPQPASDAPAVAALAKLAAQLCNAAGLDGQAVESVMTHTALASEKAVRDGVANMVAVRDLCKVAKLPEMSASLIASGMSADAARARLFDKLVANAGEELDNRLPEEAGVAPKKGPNPVDVYANRRAAKRQPANSR
ncbi:head maturation protease, ClpP-related [Chromobacterium haemolyticum]|uniref:ATP-dependent Clp protease proteolytic subunit n=1 Tax=Chromobacterium haemolyticum TaxID=394935 RepID=A0A1W0CDG0_9NEIS|nr:head maturation protease, ClpP-related [Chromobacterium haemolyticum]OQS32820.1 hypothetical protein B0T45_21190 [Chromobacterium haemolyticum]